VNGVGGVLSIRRSTSASLTGAGSGFFGVLMVGV
jgi:hypothetical protein